MSAMEFHTVIAGLHRTLCRSAEAGDNLFNRLHIHSRYGMPVHMQITGHQDSRLWIHACGKTSLPQLHTALPACLMNGITECLV